MDDVTYPAPPALVAHCKRRTREAAPSRTGLYDLNDVKALYAWLFEHDAFPTYMDWVSAGMIAKVEFGDAGLDLWSIVCHDQTVDAAALAKWDSFSADATGDSQTLGTLLKRAHEMGWRGSVRKSAMFDGVAAIAAAAGATLSSGMMPLSNTAAVVADLGQSTVESFLAATSNTPSTNSPVIPDSAALFESLNPAIAILLGIPPKEFRAGSVVDLLAVLSAAHGPTFIDVCARIRATGAALPENKLSAAVARFEAQVRRAVRTAAGWAIDSKGKPDSSNTDNVAVGMRIVGADMRFNDWSNRQEIRYSEFGDWEAFQEKDFDHLVVTFANGQYNFHPPENLLKRSLKTLAREVTFDPVKKRLAAAQAAWDGVQRLDGWLTKALGVPDDAYHTSVGRSLLGGICKRVRRPGCKHDDVVILMGPEDTLKSTFCRALAMDDAWFTDSVDFSGSPQNTIPQLFGRVVVELAELDGMERAEVKHIKRFMSAQTDNVTLKYETYTSDHARRCVFIGTSNESNPLRGDTGNRRFLPVHIEKRIDIDYVRANLDQLMGEAATLEAAGELFLMPKDVIADARARQESIRSVSDFEVHLQGWFSGDGAGYIAAHDLASLLKDATGRSVPPSQYGKALARLGFVNKTKRIDGIPTAAWHRGEGARYAIHRDGSGRMSPKQMFAGVVGVVVPLAPSVAR